MSVRRMLAAMTLAAGCATSLIARGADDDVSSLQQRVDRLETLTERVEAVSAIVHYTNPVSGRVPPVLLP